MRSARLAPALDSRAPEASPPGHCTRSVVASSVYANGRRVADISIDDAGDWARKGGHVVWIGLLQPDAELPHRVRGRVGRRQKGSAKSPSRQTLRDADARSPSALCNGYCDGGHSVLIQLLCTPVP
jgi:hypothetical protein